MTGTHLSQEDITAVADAVIERLLERDLVRPRAALVDARELARVLDLGSRADWVRANWRMLGGVRLGTGPGARLRFDVERAIGALREHNEPKSAAPAPVRRRRARSSSPTPAPLIEF